MEVQVLTTLEEKYEQLKSFLSNLNIKVTKEDDFFYLQRQWRNGGSKVARINYDEEQIDYLLSNKEKIKF